MSRDLFQKELADLQDEILVLGSMAEKAVLDALESLRDGDILWSEKLIEDDSIIDDRSDAIEEKAIFVLASQQPMATDLRMVLAMLFIASELERIADHAEGIAKINVMLGPADSLPRRLGYIPAMSDRAIAMLRSSLKALIDRDVASAAQVIQADDEVDRLQNTVYDDCIGNMLADPSTVKQNTYMLWAAHNFERIADRCTNICERVIFLVTGKTEEGLNVSTY